MLLTSIAKVLLSLLFLYCCNGAPPRKRGYTEKEEKFIVDEVKKYPEDPKPIYGMKMWESISQKYKEKRRVNSSGLPRDRTPGALRSYFLKKVLKKKGIIPVQPSLLRLLPVSQQIKESNSLKSDHLNVDPGENMGDKSSCFSNGYNSEEDRYIMDKLLAYPSRPVPIHGTKLWLKMAEDLKEERKINPARFPYERSGRALQNRFSKIMKTKFDDQEREDVIKEIRRGALTETEGNNGSKFSERYTSAEEKFLMDEVLNYPEKPVPIYGMKMWLEVADHFHEKRKSNSERFTRDRPGESLRRHFLHILESKLNDQERHDLMKEIRSRSATGNEDTVKMKFIGQQYTPAEEDFIIEELLQPSCNNIISPELWREMKKKHDQKLLLKTPGFFHGRPYSSLRAHFLYMVRKGTVPAAVMEKFAEQCAAMRATYKRASQFQGESAESQDTNEEDSDLVFAMVEEFLNAPVDVDFSRLL